MSAIFSALRDTTFGRKVANFIVSTYALTVIYAESFTREGLRDGANQPAVTGHEHIVNFIRWIGLSDVAAWVDGKIMTPMSDNSTAAALSGTLLVITAVAAFCVQKPTIHEIPAQPAYGVVLGASIMVDFSGANLWLIGIGTALGVFGSLFVFGHAADIPWNTERIKEPIAHTVGSLPVAIFSAPGTLLSFITTAPTTPPVKITVTRDPLENRS